MRKLTVLDYLDETVKHYPEKCAVICEEDRITYRDLYEKTIVMANSLLAEIGEERQRPVLIFMEKSIPCIVSIYAILRTGNVYVPTDVKTPLERIKHLLDVMGSDIVISTKDEKIKLQEMGYEGKVLIYEELTRSAITDATIERLQRIRNSIIDTELMYLLFTSGSTGIPKAVAVRHRSVMDYVDAFIDDSKMSEDDVIGNQTPFYADMSLKDLMSLYVGGTLVIIPQRYFMTPKKLLQYLDDNKVTTIMWVPTAYRLISQFDGLGKIKPSSLKHFLFSGEAMPLPVLEYWISHYSLEKHSYIQQYGPTEITGACTTYHISNKDLEKGVLPIGRPFRNTGIIILDDNGDVITDADIDGEICVYGTCLTAGYYNDEANTRKTFVQFPKLNSHEEIIYKTGDVGKYDDDGNMVFVSRKDSQIKHGGKRIELGEIETAAQRVNGVNACCCVHNSTSDELVMIYSGLIEDKDVKKGIANSVPKYMIPTRYIKLDELPMLPNGKLDRKKMQKMAEEKEG